jgi:hypothetical protein
VRSAKIVDVVEMDTIGVLGGEAAQALALALE